MSLSPEEVGQATDLFFHTFVLEVRVLICTSYINISFDTAYVHYCLTTLADEVSIIWPQTWGPGKVLFLVTKYTPLIPALMQILLNTKVRTAYSPKSHGKFPTQIQSHGKFPGSRRSVLTLSTAILQSGEAVYANVGQNGLGTFLLGVGVFYVRYRKQKNSYRLFVEMGGYTLYRCPSCKRVDGCASCSASPSYLQWAQDFGLYNIPEFVLGRLFHKSFTIAIEQSLQTFGAPILACRLLLNLRRSEDDGVRSRVVSTLVFDTPRQGTSDESEDYSDDEYGPQPVAMVQFSGIARRRGVP
ncbi:hypothetical protein DFP72DRAFT_855189 [Ephemerocybe angulata]|uniref:DUF6533 domain-containing protein n=1 Tax=Ephemerocybe angulata TaxID=980116 RepID=A0A8H6HH08_9AGAR|nr:hypothetical protein DFP72DRAFT_855189 [Tulosesus angulatus]